MRRITLLLTFLALAISQKTHAQTDSYYIYGDSVVGCQNQLVIYVHAGANADNGHVSVNWGDGNTQDYPFSVLANNYTEVIPTHTYTVPGVYTAHIDVYSDLLAANIDAGADRTLTGLSQTACGWFYGEVYQQSPSFSYYDAQLDCVDANGQLTTVTTNTFYYAQYSGLNPSNAPYTVSVNPQWLATNGLAQVSPNAVINSFNANGMADITVSLEVTCNSASANPDFQIFNLWSSDFVAVNQSGTLGMMIANTACSNTSTAHISVDFPAIFTPITTNLTNPSVVGNTLSFDVNGVSGMTAVYVGFTFPGATPSGTPYCFDVTVSHPNEIDPSNNTGSACGAILNSYDPNNKEVNLPEQINPAELETLKYTIHFQNDGNYSAMNVTVVDTISENLNLSTFKLLGAKHGVSVNINTTTRVVSFVFNSIMLASSANDLEASQGFVSYSIEEVNGLTEGEEIKNTAYIYFDYNPAIVTNTAYNINSSLSIQKPGTESLVLYPNPAQASVSVLGKGMETVNIIDITGKEVLTAVIGPSNVIDISTLANGMYTCILTGITGTIQEKLVVRK